MVLSSNPEHFTVVRLRRFKKPGELPYTLMFKVLRGNSRTIVRSSDLELSIVVQPNAIIMYLHLVAS